MTSDDKLTASLWEADRHVAALNDALTDWAPHAASPLEVIERDRAVVRVIDQLLFRFARLQDALGERLVPATLAHLAEPFENLPMRDRLNRLEKLGYLNVDDWLRWRGVSNQPAHEYPDAPALRHAALKAGIAAAGELERAYAVWRKHLVIPGGVKVS